MTSIGRHIKNIEGKATIRVWDIIEKIRREHEEHLHNFFTTIAKYFVDAALGSEEEADLSN